MIYKQKFLKELFFEIICIIFVKQVVF